MPTTTSQPDWQSLAEQAISQAEQLAQENETLKTQNSKLSSNVQTLQSKVQIMQKKLLEMSESKENLRKASKLNENTKRLERESTARLAEVETRESAVKEAEENFESTLNSHKQSIERDLSRKWTGKEIALQGRTYGVLILLAVYSSLLSVVYALENLSQLALIGQWWNNRLEQIKAVEKAAAGFEKWVSHFISNEVARNILGSLAWGVVMVIPFAVIAAVVYVFVRYVWEYLREENRLQKRTINASMIVAVSLMSLVLALVTPSGWLWVTYWLIYAPVAVLAWIWADEKLSENRWI